MTAVTSTLHTTAAEALASALPTAVPLVAVAQPGGPSPDLQARAADAVVASFVGGVSADLAVVLLDLAAITAAGGVDSGLVSVADVLRPSLEAAVAPLGAGVLGEGRRDSAVALVADPEAVVFALTAAGQPMGWVAIRIRENGTVAEPVAVAPVLTTGNLGRINSVEMTLTVEIGRTRMSVRDVLGMEPGAVVELDRSAGAPADVLLNGRLIAHGEVVVVDQDYAVRITKILDVAETV
ncbi:flagellar motor switch protein FliN [Curtobacterium herbarum]|uniref:Flagellar motor switch protein FliN-like C-terminal domain-containing protein n=1 Tax=Curtobacterium herbarum TaxID=150122 RepID=A0ABN1ZFB2_9MICO|nr:flagellar motor switch protein FliN [Curtobacterium herbarum]MBM7475506.1 flagellar motor switch protein FliN/FliY [Curtobacterium herbarum]MCS6543421.1 flagellar motor switch protein FliN [Curtobacterium herbarum]